MINYRFRHTKFLICSDSKSSINSYLKIFEKLFEHIESHYLEKGFTLSDYSHCEIILFDIFNYKNLNFLNFEKKSLKNQKIILLVPSVKFFLSKYNQNINFYDLLLSKPMNISKLIKEIVKYSENIESSVLIEDKNNVLLDVLNLNPSSISVYSFDEKLFFGNKKFLSKNNLSFADFGKISFKNIFKTGLTFYEILNKLKNDEILEFEKEIEYKWIKYQYFKSSDGYLIDIQTDITKEKRKEKRLEESAIFFEHSNEGIMVSDKFNKIVSVNTAFCKITGYTKDEIAGKSPSILKSGIQDNLFYQNMWESLNIRNMWQGEIWNKRKNGEIYPQWLSISKVISKSLNTEYYISMFTDISSLKEADKKIYFYANHDSLTALPNRVSFEKRLNNALDISKKNNAQFALFFIDIDNFKYINDAYGHDIGDELIIIVGKRISKVIREHDMLARIGGDEFTLIMNNIKSKIDVESFVQKIIKKIKEPIIINHKQFNVTLSIGISIFPEDGTTKKELLKTADTAMYVVKENGRDGYRLYNPNFSEEIKKIFNIQNDLSNAIEKEEIEVYFQPSYDLKTNKIIGAEVLARWMHKEKGFIPPLEFIKYAESANLIAPLTKLILKKSCEALLKFKQIMKDKSFLLAINISAKHFYDKDFENNITDVISDFSLSPYDFELELTETHIMKNHELSIKIINSMKNKGFKFALDDFGTGYSSLSYLKKFPLDKLKIDKSFVDDCVSGKNDFSIVKIIIEIGKIFDLKIQAEGVENQEQLNILKSLSCDNVQGYFLSKPLKYEEILGILE